MQKKICYSCFREKENGVEECPYCGYREGQNKEDYPFALPEGTVLNGCYIVGRVLGQGGFGITYIAQDYRTKALVAIKEYYPDTMAARMNSHSVSAYSGQRAESFQYGKECFLEEAKTLAEFIGNPNIVRVHCYFEENGTAYFAMDYVEGESLQKYLKNRGGKISWEETKKLLFPIMDALTAVHAKGIIHRDVSPDNIVITNDGSVKLLDFGAARYSLGDKSRSLDVVLKHGFAPKEQYTRHGRQGPYTDVYSLAATMYYAITFRLPPDSIDRFEEDDLILPSSLGVAISPEEEDVVVKALAVRSSDRYQNMAEFKQALMEAGVPEHDDPEDVVIEKVVPENNDSKEEKDTRTEDKEVRDRLKGKQKWIIPAVGIIAVILILAIGGRTKNTSSDNIQGEMYVSKTDEGDETSDIIKTKSSSGEATEMVSLEKKRTQYSSEDGSISNYVIYEYDEEGNGIGETMYSEDGSLLDAYDYEYEYDGEGNVIKKTVFFEDGRILWWYEYGYDGEGHLIKEELYYEDGTNCGFWVEYGYNEEDQMTKKTWLRTMDQTVMCFYDYEYNEEGKRMRGMLCGATGYPMGSVDYIYNSEGFLIEEISLDENDQRTEKVEYTVTEVPVRKNK